MSEAGHPAEGPVDSPETAGSNHSRTGNPVPEPNVASMFDSIAPVYDRMNTIMTAGMDGRWRRAAVRAARVVSGGSALDVACGTGKLTAALAAAVGPNGRVIGVDLSTAMIEEARRVFGGLSQVEFVAGNALALPFGPDTFDAATIAFGLRNLASFGDGFAEMARVVRPGGRVVCLELSTPRPRFAARVYLAVFGRMAPFVGRFFGRRDAYAYLPHSLDGFPGAAELADTMRRVGLVNVTVRRLAFGAVALHAGEVPGPKPGA